MRILAFVLAGAVASTGAAAVSELHAARAHLASPTVTTPPDEAPPVERAAPARPLALTPSSRGGGALPFGGVPSQPIAEEKVVTRELPHPVVLDVEDRCPDRLEDYDGPADVDGCPDPLPANGPVAVVNGDITGELEGPITIPPIQISGKARIIYIDQ